MSDGFGDSTRFRIAAVSDGWMNLVISPALIENAFQLMIERDWFWLMVTTDVPSPAIVALAFPPTTDPPTGLAKTRGEMRQETRPIEPSTAILILIDSNPDGYMELAAPNRQQLYCPLFRSKSVEGQELFFG